MIQINEIEINITLPTNGIGMVLMQPYPELNTNSEPFCWLASKRNDQITRIVRTLNLAKQEDHGCEKTHFTIFPEYSVPGLIGIETIENILKENKWKNGTIIIAGIDGLNKQEYSKLINQNQAFVHPHNTPDNIPENEWVNCCITWVKNDDGELMKYIQPKLCPNWIESNITSHSMFHGNSVNIFKASFTNDTDCYFFSLICFDWIGQIEKQMGIWEVLSKINSKREILLHFLFVLQLNSKPNNKEFLVSTENFFTMRTKSAKVHRDNCTVVFANNAGSSCPGISSNSGCSSFICKPDSGHSANCCAPGFATYTTKLRKSDNLGRCVDALLRESGACIHSINLNHPALLNLGVAARSRLLKKAITHPIDNKINDPRIAGTEVPASVKWVNDKIDSIIPITDNRFGQDITDNIINNHEVLSSEIRGKREEFIRANINNSIVDYKSNKDKWIHIGGVRPIENVDYWDELEENALNYILKSSSILKSFLDLSSGNCSFHAIIKYKDDVFYLLTVAGRQHEDCLEYAKEKFLQAGINEQIKLIVVTIDKNSSRWFNKFNKYNELSLDSFTNPINSNHTGFQNLFEACIFSNNLKELNDKIKEELSL